MSRELEKKIAELEAKIAEQEKAAEEIRSMLPDSVLEGSAHSSEDFVKKETFVINNFGTMVVQVPNKDDEKTIELKNKKLYTILSFFAGFCLLLIILMLSVFFPTPTSNQLRVWTTVLALAAGAFYSVAAGKINVNLSMGKRLLVGAAGAIGVMVIVYFFNPAIL